MNACDLDEFDKDASRYHSEVFQRKRVELQAKCNDALYLLFVSQLQSLLQQSIGVFTKQLQVRTSHRSGLSIAEY